MMKKMLMTAGLLLLGNAAVADVTQDCILTGRVDNSAQQVQVTFLAIEHGSEARCRINRGRSRSRIEFTVSAEDGLQELPTGSKVIYRYFQQSGEDQWELLETVAST